jgi:fluoroquinolone resistance protein
MKDIRSEKEFEGEKFDGLSFTNKQLIGVKFYSCTFTDCDFSETSFRGCRFVDCKFSHSNLSMINISEASFSRTHFSDSKAIGINFASAELRNPKYNCPIGFFKCALNHSTFMGLDLKGIVMQECFAKDVDFRDANLSKGRFEHTDFKQSLFGNTDLTFANFNYAKNYMIDAMHNDIKQAKFMMPEAMSFLYCLDIDLTE